MAKKAVKDGVEFDSYLVKAAEMLCWRGFHYIQRNLVDGDSLESDYGNVGEQ